METLKAMAIGYTGIGAIALLSLYQSWENLMLGVLLTILAWLAGSLIIDIWRTQRGTHDHQTDRKNTTRPEQDHTSRGDVENWLP